MALTIEKIDHTDPAVKERLRTYLAPYESHALFLLGNLRGDLPATLYAASEGGQWAGICGYYDSFKSIIPFSLDRQAVRELVAHVAAAHGEILWCNGIDYIAEPALEVLSGLGYELDNDPHQVFLELDGLPPPQPGEELCRLIRAEDAERTVRVLRALKGGNIGDPVTSKEKRQLLTNPDRWVLVQDGQVASTAASGLGIAACQIIGVATHPNYRQRGYARAVCACLIRAMTQRGAQRTVLFTDTGNAAAKRCYGSLGFQITGKYYVAKFKPRKPATEKA